MTEPIDLELLELATPYALNAISDAERAAIDQRVADAPERVAQAFSEEVRAVRETMALASAATAAEPPAHLRAAVLAAVQSEANRPTRWRTIALTAAAAMVLGLAGFGLGIALRPSPTPTLTEQIMAAPDLRTVSRRLADGGTATVLFSRDRNAGVLVMNNVPPPSPGSVYQMWLLDNREPISAGTMNSAAVAPSTTAVLPHLGDASALAFTVEPGAGSPKPTGKIFAELPLR
ncbi:anti-sigma factor [Mycobacterium sp.]|uniref:anti-sigma factor n=1 Tax=Mycobacterium sp. TaxID=1785 RepID=UPI001277D844|nr:anti-sigma factor [Mycobacterium sp.]KAA8966887.1 MAG: anti-sigma factor [Mycobacterium sp.]